MADETNNQVQDDAGTQDGLNLQPGDGKTSEQKGGSTSEQAKQPRTYSESEVKKAVSDANVPLGRKIKELEKELDELRPRASKADELEQAITVHEIAKAKGVDPERLKEKAKRYNLVSKEDIEDLAATLATGKPVSKPDSGVTTGGGKADYSQVKFGPEAPSGKDMIKAGMNKKQ